MTYYKLQKLYDDGNILWDIANSDNLKDKAAIFEPQVISPISKPQYLRLQRFIYRCEGPCIEIVKERANNEKR